MSKKRRQGKNPFATPRGCVYAVRLGAERWIGVAVTVFSLCCGVIPLILVAVQDFAPLTPDDCGKLALGLLIFLLPAVVTLYCFRFRIEFKDTGRELRCRYFFRWRTVKLSEITEVYRKFDGKVTYLHIRAPHLHLRVNTVACDNARELTQFLMTHIPKRVTLRTRNYPKSLR